MESIGQECIGGVSAPVITREYCDAWLRLAIAGAQLTPRDWIRIAPETTNRDSRSDKKSSQKDEFDSADPLATLLPMIPSQHKG